MKLKRTASNILLVLGYYRRYAPGLFWGQILFRIIIAGVFTLQAPVTMKYLLDALTNRRPIGEIVLVLAAVALMVFLRHVYACYIVEYLDTVGNITVREKVLGEVHAKASEMDLEYYETPQFYTDYVWAVQQATGQFEAVYNSFIGAVERLAEVVFMGGVMVVLDPVLLLFALAMCVIRFFAQRRLINLWHTASVEAKPLERERDYAKRVFYLNDYAKEIRMSDIHEVIHDRFDRANGKLYTLWKKEGRKVFAAGAAGDLGVEAFGTFGMYSYLAYRVLVTGSLSFGDVAALSQSAGRFSLQLLNLLGTTLQFAEQSIYVDKFRKFMDYEPKIEGQQGACPGREPKALTLKNVSFTYNGASAPSLKNVNMTIRPHEKIAIVGYNGAGKTTLIKLLMRLYDPTEGEIFLGDRNIREFNTEEYRKEFAAVFQDYQIFAATLGENVVMDQRGNRSAAAESITRSRRTAPEETEGPSEEEKAKREEEDRRIRQALCQSDFGEKLEELPLGIDTPLTREFEPEGEELSGGERQKVAIARAFFRDTPFAVMDEPSSALDPVAEYRLNQNMMEIARHRTVIFISHRLSTTVMADRIYMFEKGEIIEVGSHSQLMALNGKYAEMFRKQSAHYQG